jgi:hypothetical protein
MEREGLEALAQNLAVPQPFQGVAGSRFYATAEAELTWYLNNSSCSRVTKFFVVNDDSFDLLLGDPFIRETHIFGAEPRVRSSTMLFRAEEALGIQKQARLFP